MKKRAHPWNIPTIEPCLLRLMPGDAVLVDGKDLARVRQFFPLGSTSFLYPHCVVVFDGGEESVKINCQRIQPVSRK